MARVQKIRKSEMSNIDEQGVKCRQCHMRLKKIILAAVAVVAALTASAYEVTPQTKIIIPNMDRTGIGDALKEAATELRMDPKFLLPR